METLQRGTGRPEKPGGEPGGPRPRGPERWDAAGKEPGAGGRTILRPGRVGRIAVLVAALAAGWLLGETGSWPVRVGATLVVFAAGLAWRRPDRIGAGACQL